MKKLKLVIVVVTVSVLVYFAYTLSNKGGSNSSLSDEALSDFAIEDTASIDKLILTDTEGNKGVTLLRNGTFWTTEDGECIQQHLVHTILETIKHVAVKSPVPKNGINNVNKNLTTHHRKVEIYVNGKIEKTWYVGQPTQDQYGTYMLLKDPEKGKSPEPFIMYLPNMFGNLETRFITNPLAFQCTQIYAYEPKDMKSIQVHIPDSTKYNFTINLSDGNISSLTSNETKMVDFDTAMVRSYVLNYRKIHFEQHNYLINQKSADSLKKTQPWFIIEVTTTTGSKNTIVLFKKKMIYEKYDYDGELIEYDRDRLWVVLNDGRLVVGQFHTFDKLMKDRRFFDKIEQIETYSGGK